jgi:hypothetical protein
METEHALLKDLPLIEDLESDFFLYLNTVTSVDPTESRGYVYRPCTDDFEERVDDQEIFVRVEDYIPTTLSDEELSGTVEDAYFVSAFAVEDVTTREDDIPLGRLGWYNHFEAIEQRKLEARERRKVNKERRMSVSDALPSSDCQICSAAGAYVTLTSDGFVSRGENRNAERILSSAAISWSDVVIVPTTAGWNFRDQMFRWFGRKDLRMLDRDMPRTQNRALVSSYTMDGIIKRAHNALIRDEQVESTVECGRLPNASVTLATGKQTHFRVQCYAVSDWVAFAVVETSKSRGKRNVRRFYKPRSDTIGAPWNVVSDRLTKPVEPCFRCLTNLATGAKGLAGVWAKTGHPNPSVLVPDDYYEDLVEMVCDRTRRRVPTIIAIEGHSWF